MIINVNCIVSTNVVFHRRVVFKHFSLLIKHMSYTHFRDTLDETNTDSYQNIWLHTELIQSDTLHDTNTDTYRNILLHAELIQSDTLDNTNTDTYQNTWLHTKLIVRHT